MFPLERTRHRNGRTMSLWSGDGYFPTQPQAPTSPVTQNRTSYVVYTYNKEWEGTARPQWMCSLLSIYHAFRRIFQKPYMVDKLAKHCFHQVAMISMEQKHNIFESVGERSRYFWSEMENAGELLILFRLGSAYQTHFGCKVEVVMEWRCTVSERWKNC